MKHLGTQTLETERLILRKINENDYKDAYNNWCNNDNVARYVLWNKHKNIEVTKKLYETWIKSYEDIDTYRWVVELKDTHELIGTIDISKKFLQYGTCEIGYCYGEKYWRKGYATEVLKRVIKFLFEECEAEVICAEFMNNNPASGRVMAKSGLKEEGLLRSRVIDYKGIRNDLICYSIIKEEYFNNK